MTVLKLAPLSPGLVKGETQSLHIILDQNRQKEAHKIL